MKESQLEQLKERLNKNGYITSIPVIENNKVHIIAGKIQKIVLEDNSTSNPNLKKFLLGLNRLEGKVLNIKDIDSIISKYNSLPSNNVKIQIIPGDIQATSIIKVINNYKPNNNIFFLYDYDFKKEHTFTGVYTHDQIFGINDKLSFYSVLGKNDYYIAGSYKFPLVFTDLTLSSNYNQTKIKDIRLPKYQFSLTASNTLYEDRLSKLSFYNTIEHYNQKEFVRDLKIIDFDVYSNETNLTYNKIMAIFKIPTIVNLSATTKFGEIKSDDIDRSAKSIDLTTDFITKNFSVSLESFNSNSENKKFSYSSGYTSYSGLPVKINSVKRVFIFDTSIYHTFKLDKISITPKLRFVKADVYKVAAPSGIAAYLEINYKNFTIGTRFSIDNEKNRIVGLQIKLLF